MKDSSRFILFCFLCIVIILGFKFIVTTIEMNKFKQELQRIEKNLNYFNIPKMINI
jgi:hypothetical protein